MSNVNLPNLDQALLKIVGVFTYDKIKNITAFTKIGKYQTAPIIELPDGIDQTKAIEETRIFEKNTYYHEFRGIMFNGGADDVELINGIKKKSARSFSRNKNLVAEFIHTSRNQPIKTFGFNSPKQELFLFPDGVGLFSIQIIPDDFTLIGLSNIINQASRFESKISSTTNQINFHEWISENVLCGIKLAGSNIDADEYSGSKFKVYCVIDIPPSDSMISYNRTELLYEFGTNSKLNTIKEKGFNTPSESYYNLLLENNYFNTFNNYDMLALLDSFTVIGTGNYKSLSPHDYYKHNTWNKTYFSLYIYNLYFRYTLFRFNAHFLEDPVKQRGLFENFLNHYNLKYISFNFLPNIIFKKMRFALGIDDEIEQFEKRLKNLATTIQEQQQKRQAFLLTIISVISSLNSIETIINGLREFQVRSGLPVYLFYSLTITIALICLNLIVKFLFPLLYEKARKKVIKSLWPSKKSRKNSTS